MVDPDAPQDELEARLYRQVLIRRLVMGVGGVALGIALLVVGIAMVVMTFTGSFGRRGMMRMGALSLVLGVILIGFGVTTLRRGEVDLDTGEVSKDQAPVPLRAIAIASSVVAIAVVAIAAWPLGIYEMIGTLDSGCRSLLTTDDLSAITGRRLDLLSISDQSGDLHCVAVLAPGGSEEPVATIEIGGDLGGGQFENHLAFVSRGAERRTQVAGLGEEAWSIDRGSTSLVAVRSGHAGAFVEWRDGDTTDPGADESRREAAIAILRTRLAVMEPFADRWTSRHGAE